MYPRALHENIGRGAWQENNRRRGGHPGHDQGRRLSIPLVVAPQDLRNQQFEISVSNSHLYRRHSLARQVDESRSSDPLICSRMRSRPTTHSRFIKAVASFCDCRRRCQGRARGELPRRGVTAVLSRQNPPLASAKNVFDSSACSQRGKPP